MLGRSLCLNRVRVRCFGSNLARGPSSPNVLGFVHFITHRLPRRLRVAVAVLGMLAGLVVFRVVVYLGYLGPNFCSSVRQGSRVGVIASLAICAVLEVSLDLDLGRSRSMALRGVAMVGLLARLAARSGCPATSPRARSLIRYGLVGKP